MSGDAHFPLCGHVDKQNLRFWGTENPQVLHIDILQPFKVTAWCPVHGGGVIAAGQTTSVDGARYGAMLTKLFSVAIE